MMVFTGVFKRCWFRFTTRLKEFGRQLEEAINGNEPEKIEPLKNLLKFKAKAKLRKRSNWVILKICFLV